MRKYLKFLTILLTSAVFSGCNQGAKQTAVTATPGTTAVQEVSNDNSENQGVEPLEIRDPALYSYFQESEKSGSLTGTQPKSSSEQAKIGQTAQLSKSSKYGIEGLAKIVSASSIVITNFSYNYGCGPLKVSLANQNNLANPIAVVKVVQEPYSKIDLTVPTNNIALTRFDTVALYCQGKPEPASTGVFAR